MTPEQGSEPWMPNGFPPPSFVVETERTGAFAGSRGRWLAAAAILGVVLLIAGLVLIANQGDDGNTALNTGSSTTALGDATPTFPDTSVLDPTNTDPNATLPPDGGGGGGGTTVPGSPDTSAAPGTTAAPGPTTAPGVLTASTGSVDIPPFDAGTDPAPVKVTLRNTGPSSLSFDTTYGFSGLSSTPKSGNIAAGGSQVIDIKLNGNLAPERNTNNEPRFSAQMRVSGSGGNVTITVNSVVRRPPTIADAGDNKANCTGQGVRDGCSTQVRRAPNQSACAAAWTIRVVAQDESGVASVTAQVTRGTAPTTAVQLTKEADGRTWSVVQPAATNVVKFKVSATDTLGSATPASATAEQTVTCPS